jgi:multicomponent Na+:H+ antiporter subunit D
MVMTAAGGEGHLWVWLCLLFASAGVFHHAGIKIPFFAFFGHDSGIRTKEAPKNMLVAMVIAAALCIFNGSFPGTLYSLLPYPVDYVPYTLTHVMAQTQLLFFSALAFACLMLTGLYPPELRSVNLDFDWVYRSANRCVVVGLMFHLETLAAEAPARFMARLLVPVWRLQGLPPDAVERKREKLSQTVISGLYPVGVTACLAVLMLALLFFF